MATSLLLADDSPTIAKILGMALQSEAYEIRSVLTAADAIQQLQANPPALFLVDLTLPEKSGYEFARLIKADAKLKSVRVVLLASAFEPVNDDEAKNCGADGVISKPFDPADLRNKLRDILSAPAKFPAGSSVQGAVSGTPVEAEIPPPPERGEISNLLLNTASGGASDADSILSGLMGGDSPPPAPAATPAMASPAPEAPSEPPVFSLTPPAEAPPPFPTFAEEKKEGTQGSGFTNASVLLDLSNTNNSFSPQEQILDISGAFDASPESKTAMLDTGNLTGFVFNPTAQEPPAPSAPPASTPPAFSAPAAPPPAAAAEAPLSANAQALSAFFEAEITAQDAKPAEDAFDSSLSSIDWGESPKTESLNAWSSSSPMAEPSSKPAESPRPPKQETAPPAGSHREPNLPKNPAGATASGSFLFDTGNSTFRFSPDYIKRITKAFTGSADEMILGKDASAAPKQHAVFPQQSNDAAPMPPLAKELPSEGGGAWTGAEVKQIEAIVRQEVQMVVREVVEKVAWEIIPELAENLIRKELDKVLREMEEEK